MPNLLSKQVASYEITTIGTINSRDSLYFYNAITITEIAEKLELVVNTEGPIHKDEAFRRAARFWGFNSVGRRIKEKLEKAVSKLKRFEDIKVKDKFYWPYTMEVPKIRNREGVEGISKKITSICHEEIGEASLFVLSMEYGIPEPDLIVQTAKVLGYRRVTEEISEHMAKSINKYKISGHIINKGDKLLFNQEKTYEKKNEQVEVVEPPADASEVIEEFCIEKVIREAINKKRSISIEYNSPLKGKSTRTIEPLKLDGKYVRAYCHLVDANRTFRIDRIKRIEQYYFYS
ncbi:MAG: DUF3320 domain-containing protein [Candidatus Ancaeobacter aquaticus]|nr:DUF3320 domain-containing protein [Candidatus Ancaeobacter aquaticus]